MNIEKYAQKYRQDSKVAYVIPQMLQKYLQKHRFTTFLDCGCGDGVLLLIILSTSKFLTGKKIFACDLSQIRIKRLQNTSTATALAACMSCSASAPKSERI